MKAMIVGAGKQGRGILAYLCRVNEIAYCFVDHAKDLQAAFAHNETYCLHLLSKNSEDIAMPCKALFSMDDPKLYQELATADLMFTSTSDGQLSSVGYRIGEVLNQLFAQQLPCALRNIILCENAVEQVAAFASGLYQALDPPYHMRVREEIGICEALSMSVSAQPSHQSAEHTLDIWAQNLMRVYINKYRMKGDLLKIKGVHYIDNYPELKKQALYTNNTSSAFISYLGYLKGYQTLPEAMRDEQLAGLLERCYQEVNDTLVKELGVSPKDQRAFAQLAKNKYQSIDDSIARHARDVTRKLGKDERLTGICLKAIHNGILPDTIAIALAAALYYEDEQDQQSMALKQMREQQGISVIIKEICQIEEDSLLYPLILQKIEWLKDQGFLTS